MRRWEDAVLALLRRTRARRCRTCHSAAVTPARDADSGASAVELALLTPLLFMILFGVIQYGYGLFQLQNFSSIVNEASRMAGSGDIGSCEEFRNTVQKLGETSGLDIDAASITVTWQSKDPVSGVYSPAPNAISFGLVTVQAKFTPFKIGAPFVPYPDEISRTQSAQVTNVGLFSGVC